MGPAYEWARLENGNVDEEFLDRSGFRERLYRGRPVNFTEILKMQERLLQQAENNGFPFAAVRVDSARFGKDGLTAKIFFKRKTASFFSIA